MALPPGGEDVSFGLMNGEGGANVGDGPSSNSFPSKLLHHHNRLPLLLKPNAKSLCSFPCEHLPKKARTGTLAADEHMLRPERGESDDDMSHLTATDLHACDADLVPDSSLTSQGLTSGLHPSNENKTQSATRKVCIRTRIRKKHHHVRCILLWKDRPCVSVVERIKNLPFLQWLVLMIEPCVMLL